MDNNAILSAGRQIYAKKRKQRQEQIPEINFDNKARRDYLTGFHKRKVARREKAQEIAKERMKQEKLEARRITREARKEEAARKVEEMKKIYGKESDGEGELTDTWIPAIEEAKFETPEHLTTVTIVEDFDPDEEYGQQPEEQKSYEPVQKGTITSSSQTKSKANGSGLTRTKVVEKTKKFRYETKAARKASNDKTKRSKARSRDDRKSSDSKKRRR